MKAQVSTGKYPTQKLSAKVKGKIWPLGKSNNPVFNDRVYYGIDQ